MRSTKKIDLIEQKQLRNDLPDFVPGDTIKIITKVMLGDKEVKRIFEGVVIRKKKNGSRSTFTVRKISYGVGVERIFPFHSPMIDSIQVKFSGRVRRARLYYLRALRGKAARIKQRRA